MDQTGKSIRSSLLTFDAGRDCHCAYSYSALTCTPKHTEPPRSTQNRVLTAPTGASVTVEPEDGQWTMPAKNYASTRFSGLEEINTANVAD